MKDQMKLNPQQISLHCLSAFTVLLRESPTSRWTWDAAVSIAFRRSPFFSEGNGEVNGLFRLRVSIAFRRSPFFSAGTNTMSTALLILGLHCLSAFTVLLRPSLRTGTTWDNTNVSIAFRRSPFFSGRSPNGETAFGEIVSIAFRRSPFFSGDRAAAKEETGAAVSIAFRRSPFFSGRNHRRDHGN